MAIKTLDIEAIPSQVSNPVGLCFFNPTSESLEEFTSDESIYLTPYEESVRRFYLVKTSQPLENNFAKLAIHSDTLGIELRAKVGEGSISNIQDFKDTPNNTEFFVFYGNYSSDIIPIDIYFKSTTALLVESKFLIKLEI